MPGATVAAGSNGEDDEVVHDFSPLLLVYASGRLERPLIVPLVPPDLDAATGVESKDVPLSPSTFVRLYLPPGASAGGGDNDKKKAKLPVVVYFHGGGFEIGSAASRVYHRFLSDLAAASPVGIIPAVAVSVDYRLAPEHVLPAAYDDSLAALKWVLSGADRWLAAHGDLARMFLAGDSTGGNICHNLAMHRMNPSAPGAPGLESLACERVMVCVAEGDHLRWRGKAYAAVVRARKKKRADEPVVAAKSWAEGGGGGPQTAVELFEGGLGHVFYLLDPEMEEAKRLLGRIAAFVSAK
ncbi:LOW QUALITY PROTEIN: hypothetical protein SETIT_7G117300v2 [Setaria italica]|uniref:Alpha/beta hydrolase fold-3 domain-containing protein n=1 Tax=Setaria italica TaxID=4555 RepID=A0A368RUH3_SETIT|nr:LOW QUALITY PROTEIN: hypothetical protein SETIT_7G117300v2 [Setaria italica]